MEYDSGGAVLMTLKSYRSLGEVPDLIEGNIPEELFNTLPEHLEKVERCVNRLSAAEVVDSCRDVLSLIFGQLVDDPKKDLANALDAYEKGEGKEKRLIAHAGRLVQRLHSHRKPSAIERHGLRPLSEEDAQLSVRCLGLVLKESGWAN